MSIHATENTLDALKGWPHDGAVDFEARFSSTIDPARLPVPAGSCVQLDSAGEYILGVGDDETMPLFVFNNSDDASVAGRGGDPSTDKHAWINVSPSGTAMAIPAKNSCELVSTAYKTTSLYPPGTLLASDKGAGADAGLLRVGVSATDTIVGIVSRGVVDNGYGVNALAFWPCVMFKNAT